MSVLRPTPDPFLVGMEAGIDRAERGELLRATMEYVPPGEIRSDVRGVVGEPLELTRRLLERDAPSARFTELLTVAAIARATYGDDPLTESEIESYLEHSYSVIPKAFGELAGTLIVVGGGALAVARIEFEWAATQLDRAIQNGADGAAQLPPEYRPWPKAGEIAWMMGLACVPFAATAYTIAIWWAIT